MGSAFGQSQDSFVYIPIQTWRKVYGSNSSMNINIKAAAADLMQPAEDEARDNCTGTRLRSVSHPLRSGADRRRAFGAKATVSFLEGRPFNHGHLTGKAYAT